MKLTKSKVAELVYTKTPKQLENGKLDYPVQYEWDDDLKGFGVRVYPTGRKSFIIMYRNEEAGSGFTHLVM